MNIKPQRINRGRPEGFVPPGGTHPAQESCTRRLPATPAPLQPESGSTEPSPLDIARDQLVAANRRVFELESTLTSMHLLMLRKESLIDSLNKQLAGVALVTPITGPAISALREAKKRKKRNR